MFTRGLTRAMALIGLAALAAAPSAMAHNTHRQHASSSHHHGHRQHLESYEYRRTLRATTGSSLTIDVSGGNRAGLRSMIGASTTQTFTVGPRTNYVSWNDGAPTEGALSLLTIGDTVRVAVRAAAGATVPTVEQTAARQVADVTVSATHPAGTRDYLFIGRVTADPSSSAVSVRVKTGDRRALRKLLGHDRTVSFTFDASTIFARWSGRVPSTITASDLHAGDWVWVHVWVTPSTTVDGLLATPAFRIAQHRA